MTGKKAWRIIYLAAVFLSITDVTRAADSVSSGSWYDGARQRLEAVWREGQPELFFPFHAHHMRFAYTKEKIDSFNEKNYGLGIGKGLYDQNGDWRGIYVMEFQDSHYKPEYIAGYGYKTYWPLGEELKFGLGYLGFLTTRADFRHYTPVPLVLPLGSLEYRRASLDFVYVPGGRGNGNVLIFFAKYRL